MPGYLGFLKPKASRDLTGLQLCHQRRSIDAFLTHCGERRGMVALGEAAAVLVGDKSVVKIGRLGQDEQRLKQSLDRRRCAKVRTTYDHRHTACGIIDDTAQMIRGRRVLSGEDRVADVGNG